MMAERVRVPVRYISVAAVKTSNPRNVWASTSFAMKSKSVTPMVMMTVEFLYRLMNWLARGGMTIRNA